MNNKRLSKKDKQIITETIDEFQAYFDDLKKELPKLLLDHRLDLVLNVIRTDEGIKMHRRLSKARWVRLGLAPKVTVSKTPLEGWEAMGSTSSDNIK